MKPTASIALLAALALGSVANAELISQTGFEPPIFTPGPLSGQNGWTTESGANGVTVSTLHPQTGSQAVLIDGSRLTTLPFPIAPELVGADAYRPMNINPVANGTPIVFIQASVRLDGPSTGTTIPDDLISANLNATDGNGTPIADLIFSSNGHAYAFGGFNAYNFETPAALGQYHTARMELNFLTRTTDFFLDGQRMGTVPFGEHPEIPPTGVFGSPRLYVLAIDDPALNPALYTGSFDNFSVGVEVPEPGGMLIIGAAAATALGCTRRRPSWK